VTLLDRADWPSTTHVVESRDGTKLHVTDAGSGRPIVFIHGLALTHEVWLPQLRALRDRYRVLGLDIRGHGDSAPGVEGYSPTLFAEDLAAVLESLDLGDAILVGHSLGGCTIGQFASDHGDVLRERVVGLVFVGTYASALAGEGWFRERFGRTSTRLMAATMGRRKQPTEPPMGRLVTAMTKRSFGGSAEPSDIRRLVEIGIRTPPAVAAACALGNLTYDVSDRLRDVDVPALVVVGAKDRTAPPRSARRLAASLPNAELVVVDGVGHPVGLQRPRELADLIDAFSRGGGGSAPTSP
jgi:pimeloyl-[acyl-carrier protein] methyl ester esterase